MEKVRVPEIKQSVFANNDAQAELLRQELKEKGIYLLNLMSSPGSGKTTTLTRLIAALKAQIRIGVMEADIDSKEFISFINSDELIPVHKVRYADYFERLGYNED